MTIRFAHILWLALAFTCGSVLAEDAIRWAPDIATARRESSQYKVPLLVHFYGDNCLPCKTLEQRVLSQSEVISTLNKFFICVKVNGSRDRQTAAEFQVHSWPTDVFVSPDGKTLYQGVCSQDLRGYTSLLENIKVMNRDRNTMLAASQPVQPPAGIAQQAAAVGTQNYAPNLPAPGANRVTSSQTPSFYNGPNTASQQQLPASVAPSQLVQSGPLVAGAQPQGITGSTPGVGQQLSRPAAPQFDATPSGQLPIAYTPQDRLAAPVDTRLAAGQTASLPFTPTTPPAAQSADRPLQTHAATASGEPMNNPYFPANIAKADSPTPAPAESIPANNAPDASSLAVASAASATSAPAGDSMLRSQPISFQPRSASLASSAKPRAVAETKPALTGYCPVALRKHGIWTKGDAKLAVRHRGRIYWMSDSAALEEFLQKPDAASPVLSGYDPMLFLKEGRLVEGSVQWGLLEEVSGAFLFFTSRELKEEYERDFDNNTRALNIIMQQAGVK